MSRRLVRLEGGRLAPAVFSTALDPAGMAAIPLTSWTSAEAIGGVGDVAGDAVDVLFLSRGLVTCFCLAIWLFLGFFTRGGMAR
jgi:hypothetical protein